MKHYSILRRALRFIYSLRQLKLYRDLPYGVCLATDIKRLLPNYQPDFVFDVGANIGQLLVEYKRAFPNANIVCFEPVKESFHQLIKHSAVDSKVKCHCLALGSSSGTSFMVVDGTSTMNRIQNGCSEQDEQSSDCQVVKVSTLDNFCSENLIKHIGLLKIDTEGFDLDVLKGATSLLQHYAIDIIQVEAGMNPENERHVNFKEIDEFLNEYKYFLFGIYDQVSQNRHNPSSDKIFLRRANLVYVSSILRN